MEAERQDILKVVHIHGEASHADGHRIKNPHYEDMNSGSEVMNHSIEGTDDIDIEPAVTTTQSPNRAHEGC